MKFENIKKTKKTKIMKDLNLDQTFGWEAEENPIINYECNAQIPGFKEIRRDDNNQTLHVSKNSYSILHNSKIEEFAHSLAQASNGKVLGFESFKGGKRVLGFVQPEANIDEVNGDKIEDYIVIGNAHDGTCSGFIGTSTSILRCENMFSSVIKDHVIKHMGDIDEKMNQALQAYKLYYEEKQKLYQDFQKMKEIEVSPDLIQSLTDRLFDIDRQDPDAEISTRKMNNIKEFDRSLKREMNQVGENIWGFFNGVTHYTTHVRGVNKDTYQNKNSNGHVFGSNADFNRKAFKTIQEEMKKMKVS